MVVQLRFKATVNNLINPLMKNNMNSIKNLICLIALIGTGMAEAVSEQQKTAVNNALKINDWDLALDLAEDLVDDFPQSSVAHYLLASAIRVKMQDVSQVRAMFSLGDYKEALATAIKLDPKNIDARTEEIGFYLFAPGIAGGDQEFAQQRIEELKTVDAFSAKQMETQLAAINKDSVKQEKLYKEMLTLRPSDPNTLMNYAGFELQRNAYQVADELLLQVADRTDPGWRLAAQYQRAKWRILAKQESAVAIELLQDYQGQLIEVDTDVELPHRAAALWRMALAYENAGSKIKAIETLRASLRVDDKFKPAEDDLERLSE